MTRVIPQIVNTKTALRAAVQALPDTVKGLHCWVWMVTVTSPSARRSPIPSAVRRRICCP